MKVFWSRCGHAHGNFGDKLTPLLLDYLDIRYQWASPEEADLIGIGSLVEKIPDDFKGIVWTSGCMFEGTLKDLPKAEILGLRGKLTLEQIKSAHRSDVALGDGGLLCDLFYQPTEKKYKLGIIPHFADQENRIVLNIVANNVGMTLIDVCAPTLDVIQRVGECEYILSSSLHGLILADSLNIPNQWIQFGDCSVTGNGFKFRDYYSNFGLQAMQPVEFVGAESLEQILLQWPSYRRPGMAILKSRLRQSLGLLAKRFGGSICQVKSLKQLREQERRSAEQREQWNQQVRSAVELLEKIIPDSERFIFVDEEQLRSEVTHATAIPFMERDGEYWGAPADDPQAISELKRLISSGVRFVVFAWPAFSWLENYPSMQTYLNQRTDPVLRNDTLQVFKIRS